MAEEERGRNFVGINIGAPGDPRGPSMDRLREHGVSMNRFFFSGLRAGRETGTFKAIDMEGLSIAGRGDASLKDLLYLLIVTKGIELRDESPKTTRGTPLTTSFTPDLYRSIFGTGREEDLAVAWRAMRADMSLGIDLPWQPGFGDVFSQAIERYKGVYTLTRSKTPDFVDTLNEKKPKTPKELYSLLYQQGRRVISTWLMVELEAMEAFYMNQAKGKHHLTFFDWDVIKYDQTVGLGVDKGSQDLTAATGVSLDRHVLRVHRNALINGSFVVKSEFQERVKGA